MMKMQMYLLVSWKPTDGARCDMLNSAMATLGVISSMLQYILFIFSSKHVPQ